VVEGHVGGGAIGQGADLVLAQASQPAGHGQLVQASQPAGHGQRVRITGQQRGDLVLRACRPQASQQHGHGRRVVEGNVGGRITGQQRGDLVLRGRRPQASQQPGHAGRVVEGNVGGGAIGQGADLVLRARLPQPSQQPVHAGRVVEGDVGGRITGQQRGDLVLRPRLPQPVQQPGHNGRVAEGDIDGDPLGGAGVAGVELVQDGDKVRASARVAASGAAFEELRGGPVEAANVGSGGEGAQVCWLGTGGGSPETRRRDQGVPVAAAVLV